MIKVVTAVRNRIKEYISLDADLTVDASIGNKSIIVNSEKSSMFNINRFFRPPVFPLKLTMYDSNDNSRNYRNSREYVTISDTNLANNEIFLNEELERNHLVVVVHGLGLHLAIKW